MIIPITNPLIQNVQQLRRIQHGVGGELWIYVPFGIHRP